MASSSKAYAKGDGSDLQQVVDEMEALSVKSDNTSDAESEASIDDEDIEEEEEEDKKSRDGDDMTFKRDPDDPEGDVGEDATTNTEIVVIEKISQLENFIDENLEDMLQQCNNDPQALQELLENVTNKARYYVEHYKSLKKKIDVIKKSAKAEMKAREKEEEKKLRTETKEKVKDEVITLNVRFADKSASIQIRKGATMKDLCIEASKEMGIKKKKIIKDMVVEFRGNSLKQRKTVFGADMKDGDIININTGLKGGGKRKLGETAMMVVVAPAIKETDPIVLKKALTLKNIDILRWVDSIPKDKLKAFVQVLDKQPRSGNIAGLIPPYLKFVNEWEELKETWLFKNPTFFKKHHHTI